MNERNKRLVSFVDRLPPGSVVHTSVEDAAIIVNLINKKYDESKKDYGPDQYQYRVRNP